MQEQSRVKNSTRNTLFGAINFMVKLLLNFIARTVFLRYLSVEYLGLNSLFSNVLTILSLAELGVGYAIVYSMYKPIAENDIEKIKSLISLYKKLYWTIGGAITILGLAIIPALPFLIQGDADVAVNLNIVYVVFLFNTVVGYIFSYRRAIIFAYQRNDIESKVNMLQFLFLNIAQILIIVLFKNFYAYIVMLPIFTVLDGVIITIISYKKFPNIRGKAQKLDRQTKKEITKNTSAMIFHKLGGAVVFSTSNIIISSFLGLAILGIYSNYYLIIASLTSIVGLFLISIRGSIGNLIATKSNEETYKIFNALNFMLFWIIGFCLVCLVSLFQDFIVLWLDEFYKLDIFTMIAICLSFYLTQSRMLVLTFKDSAGLFWNDRFKPLFEAGINLGLAIIFVKYFGLWGIFGATIISTVLTCLWVEPYILFKHHFKQSVKKYYLRYLIYVLITLAVCGIVYIICYFIPSGGLWYFVLKCAVCAILPNLLFLLFSFKTNEFKYLLSIIKTIFSRKGNGDSNNNQSEEK